MTVNDARPVLVRTHGKDGVASALGWFSLALGAAQVAAPARLNRLIGVSPKGERQRVMRAVGVREIATGAGILARRRPVEFLWARVAGDAIDLALLVAAAKRGRKSRVAAAIAAVAGVTVPDVLESARLTKEDESGTVQEKAAVTIRLSPEETYERWRRYGMFAQSDVVDDRPGSLVAWRDNAGTGSARFLPAPGGRGTEVHAELEYAPRLTDVVAPARLDDELRRFKQLAETGEVVRSDAAPEPRRAGRYLRQRPAQPLPTRNGGAT